MSETNPIEDVIQQQQQSNVAGGLPANTGGAPASEGGGGGFNKSAAIEGGINLGAGIAANAIGNSGKGAEPNSVQAMQEKYRQNVLYADTFGNARADALKEFGRDKIRADMLDGTGTMGLLSVADQEQSRQIRNNDKVAGPVTDRQREIANALRDPANNNLKFDESGALQWSPSSGFDDPAFGSIPTNEMKKSSSIWGKIGMVAGIAGAVVATVATAGVGSPILMAAIGGATSAGGQVAGGLDQRSKNKASGTNQERGAQNQYKLDVLLDQLKNPGRELQNAASGSYKAGFFDAAGQHETADGLRKNETFNLDKDFKWAPPPGLVGEFDAKFPKLDKKQADEAIKAAIENRKSGGQSERYKNLPQEAKDAIDAMEEEDRAEKA